MILIPLKVDNLGKKKVDEDLLGLSWKEESDMKLDLVCIFFLGSVFLSLVYSPNFIFSLQPLLNVMSVQLSFLSYHMLWFYL